MTANDAIVGGITVLIILGVVFVLAWIMSRPVNPEDMDDEL